MFWLINEFFSIDFEETTRVVNVFFFPFVTPEVQSYVGHSTGAISDGLVSRIVKLVDFNFVIRKRLGNGLYLGERLSGVLVISPSG